MPDHLLTVFDVAVSCQVSTKTVLRAIKSGHLRATRLGEHGAFRISPDDFEAWLSRSEVTLADVRADPRLARKLAGRVVVRDHPFST
jgi:excisionase family DNA binding protein